MVIDEHSRHDLFKRLEEILGEQEASTLMAHLPPVGWADVATKADLENLRVATKADLENLRVATKADLEKLRVAAKGDFETLGAQMDAKLHRMESSLLRTILFTNSASILTVGGLAFAAARLI